MNAAQTTDKPHEAPERGQVIEGPHAAPVVKITDDHKYKLEEAELDKVLMRADIQDLPVAVVSVAGVFRAGKSFLLNFFLRYLTSPDNARADGSWLSEGNKALEGFSWKVGGERNTTGILLWSEPIVTVLPSGQKVAILLMDTQGTFDSTSTFRDCSTVFALSILLSSVQIYNLKENITENDLQHLQFFTDYGRAVNNQSGKPFQTLEFLVRDWPYPFEHPYGEAGGAELLANRLTIRPNQPKELREVREQIHALFDKVSCFLMPHPGFAVMNPKFKGAISEILPDFKTHLNGLVLSLFSSDKLLLKKINGDVVTARDFHAYFKAYMKIFNSDSLPPAETIAKTAAEAGFLMASEKARKVYEEGMASECGVDKPSVPSSLLQTIHDKWVANARAFFMEKKKLGSKEDANQYLEKLMQDLASRLNDYKAINLSKIQEAVNNAKKAYEDSISKLHGNDPLCVHAVDLEQVHSDAVNAAIQVFDAARPKLTGTKDDERTAFIKGFEERYQKLRLENVRNNISAVMAVRLDYQETMQKKSMVTPPLSSADFKKEHESALAQAIEKFKSRRNKPDSYTEDVYKHDLIQAITASFTVLKVFNKSKNKEQLNRAFAVYNDYINIAWRTGQCLHPEDLIADHKNGKCRALVVYKPSKLCYEGYDFNDEDEALLSQMLEVRYEELRNINDIANQEAIQLALEAFMELLEDRLKFSWWWLLIIPLFKTALEVPQYVKEAKQAAYNKFYMKRRPGGLYTHDQYLDRLNEMMNSKIQK